MLACQFFVLFKKLKAKPTFKKSNFIYSPFSCFYKKIYMLEKCNRKMRFAIRLLDELNKCKKGIHEPRARFYYIKINCNPGTQGQLLQSNCSELQKKLQFLGSFLKTKFQMLSLKCRQYVKHTLIFRLFWYIIQPLGINTYC